MKIRQTEEQTQKRRKQRKEEEAEEDDKRGTDAAGRTNVCPLVATLMV